MRHALKLHRNWNSASPVATRRRAFTVTDANAAHSSRIVSLHFITLDRQTFLLSVCIKQHSDPRLALLELWDIDADVPACVARRQVRWSGGYAVNTRPTTHDGILTIKTPHVEIWTIDLTSRQPDSAFITLATLPSQAKSVLSFTGSTLILRGLNDEINILDANRPLFEVELRHPQPVLPTNQPYNFESIINKNYAILLRATTLELYSLSSFRSEDRSQQVVSPVFVHTFPWRIDSSRMEQGIGYFDSGRDHLDATRPINILLRFSSLFPWPVNLLQHYVLHPDSTYSSELPVTAGNIPYRFSPILKQTIASPVRLFAVTDMALGPYGSALWLDSHTEDYFMQGEIGQRLAGLVLTPVLASDDDNRTGADVPAAPLLSDSPEHSQAAMVFDVQEQDDWLKIAMDEWEGRIAVGSVTGRVVLYDYA
ncbi:hypothetical protein WG66_004776 [Moniliophthora roreri]|nr:hypothetical protein WG66_004776 [Moniliophthora roreri]